MRNLKLNILCFCIIVHVALSLVFSCIALAAEDLVLPAQDYVPPVIQHDPMVGKISADEPITISARVTDNIQIKEVLLFYKAKEAISFVRLDMTKEADSDRYSSTITDIKAGTIQYYIRVSDVAGNIVLHGQDFDPLKFEITGVPPIPKPEPSEPRGVSKWVWIGLGAVAAGAAIAASGGGNGGDDDKSTVVITAPVP